MDIRLSFIVGWFALLMITLVTLAFGGIGTGMLLAFICLAYLLVLKRSWGVAFLAFAGEALSWLSQFVARHPLGTWLAVSVVAFGFTASNHLFWWAFLAFLSAVCAGISMTDNGWRILRGRAGQASIRFLKMLSGIFGIEKAIVAWLVILFLALTGPLLSGEPVGEIFQLIATLFVLLMFLGLGVIVWRFVNKK
jgi:hypothetical protein